MNILCLDIGGTNPRMAIVSDDYKILAQEYIDKNRDSVVPAINDFLTKVGKDGVHVKHCCVCVAGPVSNNKCPTPTNAKFPINDEEILQGTLLEKVLVINDFAAVGHAVATFDLHDDRVRVVRDVDAAHMGTRAIIGPGTGLGVAFMTYSHGYSIHASEGGHIALGVYSEYLDLLRYIQKRVGHKLVDAEMLVSGQAIAHIAKYFLDVDGALSVLFSARHDIRKACTRSDAFDNAHVIAAYHDGSDVARVIAEHAKDNTICAVTMHIFMECLGMAAQALALMTLPNGGLYIAGGIPIKNQELLLNGVFERAFLCHPAESSREFLESVRISLITNYDISYFGCAHAALETFDS